jgi:hypothetical protein
LIMGRHLATALVAFALNIVCLSGQAQAGNRGLPCDAFGRNPDGSWTALRKTQIPGTPVLLVIQAGGVLRPGAAIMGLDLATMLDRQCPPERKLRSNRSRHRHYWASPAIP